MTIAEFRDVLASDNKRVIYENEIILEKAFNHCILLKSIPCIKFMFEQGSKYLLRLSINITTVVTLVTEYEDKTIQRIIKLLLTRKDPENEEEARYCKTTFNPIQANNSLYRNKNLERMSTDFIVNSESLVKGTSSFYEEYEKQNKSNQELEQEETIRKSQEVKLESIEDIKEDEKDEKEVKEDNISKEKDDYSYTFKFEGGSNSSKRIINENFNESK